MDPDPKTTEATTTDPTSMDPMTTDHDEQQCIRMHADPMTTDSGPTTTEQPTTNASNLHL